MCALTFGVAIFGACAGTAVAPPVPVPHCRPLPSNTGFPLASTSPPGLALLYAVISAWVAGLYPDLERTNGSIDVPAGASFNSAGLPPKPKNAAFF